MSEIKILKKTEEPLLKRTFVSFEVSHRKSSTPKRNEVKSKLATLLGVDEKLLVIDNFKSSYGINKATGPAYVYSDEKIMASAEGKTKITKEREGKAKKGTAQQK